MGILTTRPPAASTTAIGISRFATAAEVQAGSNSGVGVTPQALNGGLGFSGFYDSGQKTITPGSNLVLPHGIGRKPILFQTYLTCVTAELGYAVGDEIVAMSGTFAESGTGHGFTMKSDATNLTVAFASNTAVFFVTLPTIWSIAAITNANWKVGFRAWG